jgi:lysozyme
MIRYPQTLLTSLKEDEGFRSRPYKDVVGKTTIGYGRNLDDNPLTEKEALYLLTNQLQSMERDLEYRSPVFRNLHRSIRREALLNMMYNLGVDGILGFNRMWDAIDRKDWSAAADEMLDSKWARQLPRRSRRLAYQVKFGMLPPTTRDFTLDKLVTVS